MDRIFVYASLLSQREMDKQCASSRFVEVARIVDRALAFTKPSKRWGGHSADVIAVPGGCVWGAVYTVSQRDLDALDKREGAPTYYRRIAVEILSVDGTPRPSAWVYEVVPAHRVPQAAPSEGYLATILAGARERGLPADYIAELEAAAVRLPPAAASG